MPKEGGAEQKAENPFFYFYFIFIFILFYLYLSVNSWNRPLTRFRQGKKDPMC